MTTASKRLFVYGSQIITDDPSGPGDVLAASASGEGYGPTPVLDILNASGMVFVKCGVSYLPVVTKDTSECINFVGI